MPSSRGSSQPRDRTCISFISCTGKKVLYHQSHLGGPITLPYILYSKFLITIIMYKVKEGGKKKTQMLEKRQQ